MSMGRAKVKRVRGRVLFWIIAGLLIAMFAGSILLLRSIALPQRYRGLIESRLRGVTNRDVRIKGASLRFLGGIGIEFEDLVIRDLDGKSDFIRARGLILQMKLLPLLRRQLLWKSLIIEKPSVRLRRNPEGSFNFSAKGEGPILKGDGEYPFILRFLSSFTGGEVRIRKGSIRFDDDFMASGPVAAGVEDLFLEFRSISTYGPIAFRAQARQRNSKGPDGRISIIGELQSLPDSLEWSKIRIAAEVRAKNVNPLPFGPYYRRYIPVKATEGFLDVHAHYEGNFSGLFRSWGQIRLKDVALDDPSVFLTVLKPKKVDVDYDVSLNMRNLNISDVSFHLPEIEIQGRCTIHEIRSSKRRIETFATTGSFRLEEVKKYLPLRVIPPGFSNLLKKVTRRGRGRIVSLRIKGLAEDFSKLRDPRKADLIYGRMRLDGVVFPFARDFHPIENISGWVTLEKGSLSFQDLKGSCGKSRLNATEMMISRLYSSPRMNLTLAGEIDLGGIIDMARPGGSPGKGIQLPVAMASGKIVYSNNRLRLADLRGKMGSSTFWGKGQIRKRLDLTLGGELDLRVWFSHILPRLFPQISKTVASFSGVSGGAKLTLKLKGRGKGFKGIRYKGRVSLGKAVFRHRGMAAPVRFRKGYIHFTPQVVRFTKMDARLKGSHLNIEGTLRNYLTWKRSKIDLRIRAPNLDMGDFNLKKGVKGGWIWRGGIVLPKFGGVAVRIKKGKWRYTDFSNLVADITLAQGRLNLEKFHCEVKGGRVDMTAWVDLAKKGGVAFGLNPKLTRVDAGRFFRDLDLEERVWITGFFNLWGNITGRGRNGKELRRSLEGKLTVGMEEGKIRRWRILSKVFSLLNVSQLFKGRLPELTGEGYPYNRITGEIRFARGIARTENLLVDSDAMRITVIGEWDLVRENLDLTVGLCPLGTVDAIVSKVPVVGRILAGEDHAVIAYYVEVKGDFSNPKVRHIPLKSMGKGLIGIIRRVLETPKYVIPMEKK